MLKVIRLSRYVFDKGIIQHNVTFSVSGLFTKEGDMVETRIHIMTTLLESLFPNTITIVSMNRSSRPLSDYEKSLKALNSFQRISGYTTGDQITLDQLKDLMLYCYSESLELELDILDIKDQHVTAVINKDLQKFHYIYGTPETFTEDYLKTIKSKLKDCTFDGSFKKTL